MKNFLQPSKRTGVSSSKLKHADVAFKNIARTAVVVTVVISAAMTYTDPKISQPCDCEKNLTALTKSDTPTCARVSLKETVAKDGSEPSWELHHKVQD